MLDDLYEYYRPNSLVVSVAGNIDPAQITGAVTRLFGDWEAHKHTPWKESLPPKDASPVAIIEKETEQVNLCLGTLGIAYSSPDYYPFILINAILGVRMSSLLFHTIRQDQHCRSSIG